MRRTRKIPRLSRHDVELILEVLYDAAQQEITVAQAVQERLSENERDVRELRKEIHCGPCDDGSDLLMAMCDRLQDDSRRVRRLMRMFASWGSSDERPVSGLSNRAGVERV